MAISNTSYFIDASEKLSRVAKKDEQADYILPIVFLKYISDLQDEKKNRYRNWNFDSKYRHERTFNTTVDFYDLYDSRDGVDLGKMLNDAIQHLQTSDVELNEILRLSDYTNKRLGDLKQRNDLLRSLVECLWHTTLEINQKNKGKIPDRSPLSDAVEALAITKGTAIRTTPDSVSHLVAELIAPQDGDAIYDPACGTGNMLLACSHYLKDKGSLKLCGAESHWSSWAAARMNFFLSCEDSQEIKFSLALESPPFTDPSGDLKKFDAVISNFPWESKDWRFSGAGGRDPSSVGSPKSRVKGDYRFILHMLASTNHKHGRIAALVSNGALSRGGEEGSIRRKLVEENLVDAVISLPDKLLFDTTNPSTILLLRYGKTTNDVLFVDTKRYSSINANRNNLGEEAVKNVTQIYRGRERIRHVSEIASIEEILRNNFDLNTQRYISSGVEDEDLKLGQLNGRQAEIQAELKLLDSEIKEWLVKVGD